MKKTGYFLAGLGILITLASLSLDVFGIGQRGIQAAQLLGINVGVVMLFLGLGVNEIVSNQSLYAKLKETVQQLLNAPVLVWLLAGFITVYVLFFIFPGFFNATQRMFYFFRYIPDQYPIGGDLAYNTSAIASWLQGNSPYALSGHFYPPLYHIVFAPVLLLGYPNSYYLVTTLTLVGLVLITFVLPFRLATGKNTGVIVFFLLTGLFSYGLQFELERGQFNVIALTLCLLGVYLFHRHNQFRYLAYFLFSVSIHLKLYPAIFIVLFVKDWKDWKGNLKRLAGLGLLNLALLFAAGPQVFSDFMVAVGKTNGVAGWTFSGNHSIKAFVYNLTRSSYGDWPWLKGYSAPIEWLLMGCFGVCFLIILFKAYRENNGRLNTDLLLACLLGGMLLPAVSIDYKLELLAAPLAMALSHRTLPEKNWQKMIFILAMFLIALAYSLTLVPYKFRNHSGMLVNSLPMLFTILISFTIVSLISKQKSALAAQNSETV